MRCWVFLSFSSSPVSLEFAVSPCTGVCTCATGDVTCLAFAPTEYEFATHEPALTPHDSLFRCMFLAQGMYFISLVILMRMNMPARYREIIGQVLGDLEFNFYHRWFDVIFLISATFTILYVTLTYLYKQQGKDT